MTDIDMKILSCDFKPLTRQSVPSHAHDCIEWHYIIAGTCGFDIGKRQFTIKTADLFAVQPGMSHGVRMRKTNDWLLQYVVHAQCEHQQDQRLWKAWKQLSVVHAGTAHQALFAKLSHALQARDQWRIQAASNRFTALLYDCLAHEEPTDDTHPHVQSCLQYMHRHLYEILSLDDMAVEIGLHKSYLIRLFKQHIGQSPLQHFTALKMELAAQLLRSEGMQVQEVCQRIGYQAAAHFSRSFKLWSGMSPAAYVRAHL